MYPNYFRMMMNLAYRQKHWISAKEMPVVSASLPMCPAKDRTRYCKREFRPWSAMTIVVAAITMASPATVQVWWLKFHGKLFKNGPKTKVRELSILRALWSVCSSSTPRRCLKPRKKSKISSENPSSAWSAGVKSPSISHVWANLLSKTLLQFINLLSIVLKCQKRK